MAISLRTELVIAVAAAAMFMNMAMAVIYNVGGPNGGWDLTSSNFQAWSNNITFMQGDTIIFVYGGESHSVLEVVKSDYDGCLTNASLSSDASGKTFISLNSVGSRYFICGVPTHCDRGMKVVITTIAAPPPPPGAPEVAPAATPSPEETPSGSPADSPVGSPAPKTASPAKSPKLSPSVSPSRSPANSPSKSRSKSPAPSPPAPASAETPANPPVSTPPPSSANKVNMVAGFTIIMMLLTL